MELSGQLLDEHKKTNEHLDTIANKEIQKVEIQPGDENELSKVFWNMLRGRTGAEGKQGEKGDPLTWEDLTEDQKAALTGKEGHTPTDQELLALIEPLIPEVTDGKDGKTPTDSHLRSLILPMIPEPVVNEARDGHTPTDSELMALINKALNKNKETKDLTSTEIIRLLKGKLSYNDLKDLPDVQKWMSQIASKISSKTYSLAELDDVNLDGLTQTDGKYNLGSGSGASGNFVDSETVARTFSAVYTLAHVPVLGSVHVFGGGSRLYPGTGNIADASTDYTVSGGIITTKYDYGDGGLLADYRTQ